MLARAESVRLANVVEALVCFAAHAKVIATEAGGASLIEVGWV